MKDTVCAAIGTLIGRFTIVLFGWSFFAMLLWNNFVAYEFNLPTFSYWAFVLLRVCIIYFNSGISVKKDA